MPANVTIRKRTLPNPQKGERKYQYPGESSMIIYPETHNDLAGTQRTVSEGHQVSLLGESDLDIGGEFQTFKSEVISVGGGSVDSGIGWSRKGPTWPAGTRTLREDEVPLRSIHELNALGATAVSRCSPVNSNAELLTSLSETLKDGLPSIPGISTWKDRAALSKGAGSEYLNAQFGWIPLVDDIKSVVSSYKTAAKTIKQFKRDAGRNVRRRYEFPLEEKTEILESKKGNNVGAMINGPADPTYTYYFKDLDFPGSYEHQRTTTVKTWFSGAFTYHLPADDTQIGKMMNAYVMADRLYGTGLTPDVLWNLTPWSWATDWFANTGDVLTNVSNASLYGQIMRYGYLMEKTTIIDHRKLDSPSYKGGGGSTQSIVKTVVKRRIAANPFGFGITFDGLDAYQLSILAALGITRR